MIGHRVEYEKMYAVERELWWYRILHQKALKAIEQSFGSDKTITILDAGCGTGGLLSFLRENGYQNAVGFDGSEDAVAFCKERQLEVELCRFETINAFRSDNQYDVIICDDVFYCLNESDMGQAMRYFRNHLKPNGLFVTNNNAFNAFYGTHDVAVGGKRRFVRADIQRLGQQANMRVVYSTYWSMFLSPLILAVRQWQALKLRKGWERPEKIVSDVELPSPFVNKTLFVLVKLEEMIFPQSPFGSSLFMTLRPC